MKRIFFAFSALCMYFIGNSQEFVKEKGVTSGIYFTAGVNGAGVVGWDDPSNSGAGRLAGFHGGISFWTNLGKRGYTQLVIEGNYSQQGFTNTEASADADNKKMFVNYFNIPVVLHYRPFKKFDNLYVGAGPQFGFKAGGHIKNVGGEKLELNEDAFVKNGWSAVGVLGINFGNYANIGIEFGYQHGLSGFLKDYKDLRHSVYSARFIIPVDVVGSMISAFGGY